MSSCYLASHYSCASTVIDRKTGLGGSDIAALLGLHPYKTPFDVYIEKVEGYQQPLNEYIEWGNILEPVVAQKYANQTGIKIRRNIPTQRHPSRRWVLATPDALWDVPDDWTKGGAEFKTADARMANRWGEPLSEDVPDEYLIQCQWYMGFFDVPRWDLAVLIGGNDFRIYELSFSQELYDFMIEESKRFWDEYIIPEIPPSSMGAKNLASYVKNKFKDHSSLIRSASPREAELMLAYKDATLTAKEAVEKKDEIADQLKLAIADSEGIELPDGSGKITFKKSKDSHEVDWQAVAKDLYEELQPDYKLADICAKHTRPKFGSRRIYSNLK